MCDERNLLTHFMPLFSFDTPQKRLVNKFYSFCNHNEKKLTVLLLLHNCHSDIGCFMKYYGK